MPRDKQELEDDLISKLTDEDYDLDNLEDDLKNEQLESPEEDQQQDDQQPEDDTEPVTQQPPPRQKQQQQPGVAKEADIDPRNFFKEDAQKNLVDDKGTIVARAGRERGLFTRMRQELIKSDREGIKLAKRLMESANLLQQVWQMYKKVKNEKSYYETSGLTPEENKLIVDLAVLSKRDPIAAAKKHLTMLHMNGIDITSLGTPGGVDAKTLADELKAHVDKRLEANAPKDPVVTREDAVNAAKTELYAFADKYPEAIPFAKFLAEVKDRYPDWSLEKCWLELKKQMQAQDAAKKAPVTDPVTPAKRQSPPQRPTTPSSRRAVDSRLSSDPADATASYEDIAKSVLAELAALGD